MNQPVVTGTVPESIKKKRYLHRRGTSSPVSVRLICLCEIQRKVLIDAVEG